MLLDGTAMLGTRPRGQEEQATPAHVHVRDTAAPHGSLMPPSRLQQSSADSLSLTVYTKRKSRVTAEIGLSDV